MRINYGKPTHWDCPALIESGFNSPRVTDSPCRRCVPVYAIIPEDRRPSTHEPDADVVCVGFHDGDNQGRGFVDLAGHTVGEDYDDAFRNAERWGAIHGNGAIYPVALRLGTQGCACTLADAVLWVIEGILPH